MNEDQEDWLELTLAAGEVDPNTLEHALLAAGALAVTLRDGGDQPVLEPLPGEMPIWAQTLVTGLYPMQTDIAVLQQILSQYLPVTSVASAHLQTLQSRDWVRAWLDDFRPMCFGRRLWVCPSSETPPDPDAVNLILDPGLAFGTGTHPTTALCLKWLDSAELQDKTVLDYGSGSGILAIASVKLGARRAWAVDIDPQALIAGTDNASHNGVSERLWFGSPESLSVGQVDILMANILAGPLLELVERFAGLVCSGGTLVLSGILSEQAEMVQAGYRDWFEFAAPRQREEWSLLYGIRHSQR